MDVVSIAIEDQFSEEMPRWDQLIIPWRRLAKLQPSWRASLKEWRGIYFVFDERKRKGYVGSAYGSENILGRWKNWSKSGHGGNKYLRESDPRNLVFSILELDAQNRPIPEIIRKENSWKSRLHTKWPAGLNGN
jgi:hypothetical protein